jgi:hypothetical protein
MTHPCILVKRGERHRIAAGDPQRAIAQDAFGIRDVPQHFFEPPFTRGVYVVASRFRKALKKRDGYGQLPLKTLQDVVFRHEVEVGLLVRCIL